jgi:hypothetical protein
MGKRKKLEERDGVIGKECTKCGEWKPLAEGFNKHKLGLGGRKSECKVCKKSYNEENKNHYLEVNRKWREKNKGRIREYQQVNKDHYVELKRQWREKNAELYHEINRNWYKENKEYLRQWREENKERKTETDRKWRKLNRDKYLLKAQRRRARKASLPDDFSIEKQLEVQEHFGGCALTGIIDETHWDHVIPLTTGYGGTIHGNMIPLRSDLNFSKNNANLFEWFYANKDRLELSQSKFDTLIAWLSAANGMTVDEYKEYVYYCHANPRDVE